MLDNFSVKLENLLLLFVSLFSWAASIASKFKLKFDCVQHVCWFLTFSMKICKFACRPEYVSVLSLMLVAKRKREKYTVGIVGRRKETNCMNFSKSPRSDLMWVCGIVWCRGRMDEHALIITNTHLLWVQRYFKRQRAFYHIHYFTAIAIVSIFLLKYTSTVSEHTSSRYISVNRFIPNIKRRWTADRIRRVENAITCRRRSRGMKTSSTGDIMK